jgi:hypothetical protein
MKTINKIIIPFITLIIGIGAGYFFFQGDFEKELAEKEAEFIKAKSFKFQSTRTIITDQTLIQKMKNDFIKESRGLFYGSDGKSSLLGYHISREDIEAILAADQDVKAIGLYFGKQPSAAADRIYTIMAMPAKLAPAGSANKYEDIYKNGVYDYTDICPDVCGTF